jgi:catechol 2,3-dioxygenase-like lactoylglutathione lyase family enzyme
VFTGLNHVCIVTGDLDRAVRTWSDRYGVGPWRLWTKDPSNMSAEFAMRVALCNVSPTARIELIQPLDAASPHAASLARHGGADHVHHLRFDVGDYGEARERLIGLGLDVVLDAAFDGIDSRLTATYFSTEQDLGFTLEIADVPAGFAMPEPELVYPGGS